MTIAIGKFAHGFTQGGTSITTASGQNTNASGSSFFVAVITDSTLPAVTGVTDTFGNSYTLISGSPTVGSSLRIDRYYCNNGTGGSNHQATVSYGSASYATAFFLEITGGASSLILDQSSEGTNTSTPPVNTGNIVLGSVPATGELLVGVMCTAYSGTPTFADAGNPGLTLADSYTGSYTPGALFTAVVNANGTYYGSFSDGGAVQYRAATIDSFLGASSGPPPASYYLGDVVEM
jgi:hypothetical protein